MYKIFNPNYFSQFPSTIEPPSCLNNVKSIISVNGSSILLPCQVQGSPTPTIKWSKDGGAELDSRFSITPKGLYLKNVRPEDAGKYQVTLSNDAATNVESVELEIGKKVTYSFFFSLTIILFFLNSKDVRNNYVRRCVFAITILVCGVVGCILKKFLLQFAFFPIDVLSITLALHARVQNTK